MKPASKKIILFSLSLCSLLISRQLPAYCESGDAIVKATREEQRAGNTLPLITIASTGNTHQAEATALLKEVANGKIRTGIYPIYEIRELYSETRPPQLWNKQDRQNIKALATSSKALENLFYYQVSRLNHDSMSTAEHSSPPEQTNAPGTTNGDLSTQELLHIDRDNLKEFRSVLPPHWQKLQDQMKASLKWSNSSYKVDIRSLEKDYGKAEVQTVLSKFDLLLMKKNQPRETLQFKIPDRNWQTTLLNLKAKLKPLNWEVFGLGDYKDYLIFPTKEAGFAYINSLHFAPGSTKLEEELPGEIILNANGTLVKTSGSGNAYVQSAQDKAWHDALEQCHAVLIAILKFFHPKMPLDLLQQPSPKSTFQFPHYAVNEIPPQATISKTKDNQWQIKVPYRWIVTLHYHRAFAAPNFNQYQYLLAEGTNGVGCGLMNCDILKRVYGWDKQYGLQVIEAYYNYISAHLIKKPEDPKAFLKSVKEVVPEMNDVSTLKELKKTGNIFLWWHEAESTYIN